MNNERLLAFNTAKKIDVSTLEALSIAGGSQEVTSNASFNPQGGTDMNIDYSGDF